MILAGGETAPSWLDAVVLGLVEGLTEFLPVSSTGHLIVTQRALGLPDGAVANAFAIGIQFGAITAILALYWRRLLDAARAVGRSSPGKPNLLGQIVIAALPVVVLGLLLEDWIDAYLFSPIVVASSLVAGGVLLMLLERYLHQASRPLQEVAGMSYRTAFYVGLWQCLALIPGTSRSGATIGGALFLGLSRPAAAELTFLVGLPILYGASIYKLYGVRDSLSGELLGPLLVATLVSFLSALLVVRPFLAFVRRFNFMPFAYYRIAAGASLFAMIAAGYLQA